MKNKKLIYILLPATLFVWGVAFMRIYKYFHADSQIKTFVLDESAIIDYKEMITDTFSIDGNYRDPFLGEMKKNVVVSAKAVIKTIKPVPEKKESTWPAIQYTGMIKNQKSSTQLAMLSINGESKIIKIGETNNEIKLNKIYRDSVEVIFNKQKKTIRK